MDIAGAFGSVAPNFPNLFANEPYRVAIDIPVQDRIARAYVPAGAIATATSPTPNDFYGTVVGLGLAGTDTGRVRLTYAATTVDTIPIRNGAFGARINTLGYLGSQRLTVEVIRPSGDALNASGRHKGCLRRSRQSGGTEAHQDLPTFDASIH